MKKIEAKFKNRLVINTIFIVLFVIAVFISLQLSGELHHNMPRVLIEDVIPAIIFLFAMILVIPFIIWGIISIFIKITLRLQKVEDRLVLTSSGLFSKTAIGEPESFEGGFGVITPKFLGREKVYFRLKITDENGKSHKFFERVDPKKQSGVEVTPIKKIPKMLISDDNFPGRLAKIYSALLDSKEMNDSDSPFKE